MLARAADFQAAWYYSLLAIIFAVIVAVASGWAIAGARRLWHEGEHGPAGIIIAATVFGLLSLLGMYAVALGGVLSNGIASGGGG